MWCSSRFTHEVIVCAWLLQLILLACLQAAKETGALLEANTKLEKQVEELTWELKKMQREKELLMKEGGGTKNIAGQVPIIKEVPVIDNEFTVKLTAENEQLKVLLDAYYFWIGPYLDWRLA